MISYVKGILTETEPDNVVIETGGIGYNIKITDRVFQSLPQIGREAKLYTHFHVREDAMQLYGFLSREDLNMFRMLLAVNGVGPKVALSLINEMSANDLAFAILADDVVTISEDLKKDIAALQRQLDTCKTFLIHCQSQHMHRNDQRFVSIPPETQLTERF